MKHAILALKLLVFAYLGYLLIFMTTEYEPARSGYSPPFILWVTDTINLFIHEAGHFFLKPFGMWIYIIGGSFFQCIIPLALLLVTWRQNIGQIVYPAFWLGENMVNVSVYIQDAPFKRLKLIAKGLIHDWNWLLAGNLEYAEPLATTVKVLGLIVCFAALGAGTYFAIQSFREDAELSTMPE